MKHFDKQRIFRQSGDVRCAKHMPQEGDTRSILKGLRRKGGRVGSVKFLCAFAPLRLCV
jgi:hypothetical protein